MEIDEQFESVTVFIECKKLAGSGCLIQPETTDYTYVLTAKHCLAGTKEEPQEFQKDDISITRFKNSINEMQLEVLEYHLSEDKNIDLAVIKVKLVDNLFELRFGKTSFKQDIFLSGYPGFLEHEDCEEKRDLVKGYITNGGKVDKKLEFKMYSSNEDNDTSRADNIQGFSGSGIYSENGKEIVLHGIYKGFKDSKSRLDSNYGYSMDAIKKMIEDLKLSPLIHYKLTSFSYHKENAFKQVPGDAKFVMYEIADKEIRIKPKDIIEKIGEKVFEPYKSGSFLEDRLWCGWLNFLTYITVMGITIDDISRIYIEDEGKNRSRLAFLHATSDEPMNDICKKILINKERIDDLDYNDTIILNTREHSCGSVIKSRSSMRKIVHKISGAELYERRGIYISKADDCTKNIGAIHIDAFSREINKRIEEDDIDIPEVKGLIKEVSEGVFKDVFK